MGPSTAHGPRESITAFCKTLNAWAVLLGENRLDNLGPKRSVWGLINRSGNLVIQVMDQNINLEQEILWEEGDPFDGMDLNGRLENIEWLPSLDLLEKTASAVKNYVHGRLSPHATSNLA